MSTSAAVFDKREFAAGVTQRFVATTSNTITAGLQWIRESGAGNATISIYASAWPTGHIRLVDRDPTTNPNWSLTPIVFAVLPGGVRESDLLPLAAIGTNALLLEITTDAPMVLTLASYQISAQGT